MGYSVPSSVSIEHMGMDDQLATDLVVEGFIF